MTPVRVGVVGLGSAGILHARAVAEQVPGAVLAAVVCRPERLRDAAAFLPPGVSHFSTLDALLAANDVCDAVIIATPHALHPEQTIAALSAGLHVFCEKPAGIRARDARLMAETARQFGLVYAMNFNRRTVPLYQEIRRLVQTETLGSLRRIQWASTAWLRVQAYYDSSPWRGTWAGEGGGLLLNQWPHTLDLWQWIWGMPSRLQAHCGFGSRHAIEVDDAVTVFAEYPNGATAVLVGATGEAPGKERIEVVCDRGTLLVENDQLRLTLMNAGTVDDFIATAPAGFPNPSMTETIQKWDAEGDLVAGITRDFIHAILAQGGEPPILLSPGADGEKSLMLANAILWSAWRDGAWVPLPLGAEEADFERLLDARIAASPARLATPAETTVFTLEDSFQRR